MDQPAVPLGLLRSEAKERAVSFHQTARGHPEQVGVTLLQERHPAIETGHLRDRVGIGRGRRQRTTETIEADLREIFGTEALLLRNRMIYLDISTINCLIITYLQCKI